MTALAEIAGMNLPQASDDAVQMLEYMTNFIAGLYTNGENGYAPANGAAYWLYLRILVTKTALFDLVRVFVRECCRITAQPDPGMVSLRPIPSSIGNII